MDSILVKSRYVYYCVNYNFVLKNLSLNFNGVNLISWFFNMVINRIYILSLMKGMRRSLMFFYED